MSTNGAILLRFCGEFSCRARSRQAVGFKYPAFSIDHFEHPVESQPPRFGAGDFHVLLVSTASKPRVRVAYPGWGTSLRPEGEPHGRDGALSSILRNCADFPAISLPAGRFRDHFLPFCAIVPIFQRFSFSQKISKSFSRNFAKLCRFFSDSHVRQKISKSPPPVTN